MIRITRTCFETFPTIGSFSTLEKRKSVAFQEIKTNSVSLQTWQMPTLIFPAWATCNLIGSWKRYEIRHHLDRNDCPELPFKLESLANGYYYKHFWWMNFSTIWYQIRWIWPGTRKRVSIHSPSDTHRSVNCLKSKHFQGSSVRWTGAPNGNFRENICSEDYLRTRIFGTFVVKFFACLPLLGFSNIYKMV